MQVVLKINDISTLFSLSLHKNCTHQKNADPEITAERHHTDFCISAFVGVELVAVNTNLNKKTVFYVYSVALI